MTINLYRRHKPNCVGGHAWQIHDQQTSGSRTSRRMTGVRSCRRAAWSHGARRSDGVGMGAL